MLKLLSFCSVGSKTRRIHFCKLYGERKAELMKQKSYGRYLHILFILSLKMGIIFPKVETFGFVNDSKKPTKNESIQVFEFTESPAEKLVEDRKQENAFFQQLMEIEASMVPISNTIGAYFKKYKQESQSTLQVFSFIPSGQPVPPPSLLGGTTVNLLDKEGFNRFQDSMIGSTSSYLSLLTQVWSLYGNQSKAAVAQNPQGAQHVIVGAFSKGSVALVLYQQIAAQCITFLKLRFSAFSLSTFFQSGAQYFLTTELPAVDKIMDTVQAAFDAHFSGGAEGFPLVKTMQGVDAQTLSNNYCSFYEKYKRQRNTLCAQFALDLAGSLAARYQPSLALSQPITSLCGHVFNSFSAVGMLSSFDQFSVLGQTALAALGKESSSIAFGTYTSPSQALQALNGSLASFYVYCALIGQNVVSALAKSDSAIAYQNQIIGSQGASQAQSPFYVSAVQFFTPIQTYYQKAGQYYAAQSDGQSSLVYSQCGSYISSGLMYWSKAEASLMNNDFPGAAASYQIAASWFKNGGNNALSSVLTHRTDAVALSDYQMLLQSYTQYYQGDQFAAPGIISAFVTQMTTPLSGSVTAQQAASWHSDYPNGFVQLFYFDAAQNKTTLTPTNQGIAWLAGQAVPVFSHMLNAYQTDKSPTGMVIKQYLQNALVILENLVQAAESMFYNRSSVQSKNVQNLSVLPQSMAADENLGSGTVQGVVEGALQYVKIYEKFSKVDAILAQPVTAAQSMNGVLQLPFQGLFAGVPISGFAQFTLLAQIYWSLMNSTSCLELLQQYPDYAQTVVSSALILAIQAQTLCEDLSLVGVLTPEYTAAVSNTISSLLQNKYGEQTGLSLLMAEGDALQKGAKTALDYESALACYCGAGLAGNVSAQTHYFETIDAYAHWYLSSSGSDYPAFYASALYYRGYLAQQKGWKSSFDSVKKLQTNIQTFTQQLATDLQGFSALVQASSYDQAIDQVQKFVILQEDMQGLLIRQKREQLCFNVPGATVSDFITVTTTTAFGQGPLVMAQVPAVVQNVKQAVITSTFPLVPTATCPQMVDPLVNLAQLYLAQGTALLDGLKAECKSGNYGVSLQDTYDNIIQSFTKAIDFFGKSDHSEMIVKVQQALTDGTAFAYYSLVIPSDKITNLLNTYTASQASFSGQFVATQTLTKAAAALELARKVQVFSFVEPKSPLTIKKEQLEVFSFVRRMSRALHRPLPAPSVHSLETGRSGMTAPVKSTGEGKGHLKSETASLGIKDEKAATTGSFVSDGEPYYLLRYCQDDLTLYAQQEKQLQLMAPRTSTSFSSGVSYQDILFQAQQLLGSQALVKSSTSDTSLVPSLVVPLYRKFLKVNGYTSPFSSLDQEVDRYGRQVIQLVTQGMRCGTAHLYTSYTLQNQTMSDGTHHVMLTTYNAPLQAVPRFQGEVQTALYYYTEYGRFYAYTPQTVQIGGNLFFQLSDSQFTHQAESFKGVMGAYFGQMNGYEQVVENCMKQAPPQGMTVLDKKNYMFSSYASLYQTVAQAYSWVLGALNGIQTVQQNQGIFWLSTASFNALNFAQYSNYMNNNARFLVGYPLTSSYKQVLTDISALSAMALSYGEGRSDQAVLSRMLGLLYETSGQLTFLYDQQAPSVDGYPSPDKTDFPTAVLNFTVKYPTCAVPLKGSLQAPVSFAIPWGNYFQSSNFYLKAYTSYQSAYTATYAPSADSFIENTDYCRAWGKYVSSLAHAVTQRLALFGRNALKAILTPTSSGTSFSFATNDRFKLVLAQGQTSGGFSAQQGFEALAGGVLDSVDSATIQNQYTLMKTLLLDAFIYCSAAEQLTQNALGTVTNKVAEDSVALVGKLLKCAFAYYVPGLQAVRGQNVNGQIIEEETLVVAWPDNEVALDKLGTLTIQQLVYSNTFPALVEYCLASLMGSEDDVAGPFNKLKNPENMLALSGFLSQLYGMLMVLYTPSFLPLSDQNDPSKIGTDIQAAIQAQEQGLIMNSESYVG
jgi:hypothetical protein